MSDRSKIEWTDSTWNPVRARKLADGVTIFPKGAPLPRIGWHCEHVSEGCRNCYAEGINRRRGTGLDYKPGHRADIELFLDEKMLTAPLRWRKPRMIFVCSMTDLFADFVKDEWIDRMFAVMALCPQHTFQVLTKRSARMRAYLGNAASLGRIAGLTTKWAHDSGQTLLRHLDDGLSGFILPNVWLGVSCEDQDAANARIPHLLATPAAIRFLSCEPLLGPIILTIDLDGDSEIDALRGHSEDETIDGTEWPGLDWVIVGGESGKNARPMHPNWARRLRDQCTAAGVPFFFKQWGAWAPGALNRNWMLLSPNGVLDAPDYRVPAPELGEVAVTNVRKKRAGRLLDGREWNEMPSTP